MDRKFPMIEMHWTMDVEVCCLFCKETFYISETYIVNESTFDIYDFRHG